jgi:hypothetical protein
MIQSGAPEPGYSYFCGNIVGDDDAWVSSY